MNTILPPVKLEDPANHWRVDWLQQHATQDDFSYPQVNFNIGIEFVYLYVLPAKISQHNKGIQVFGLTVVHGSYLMSDKSAELQRVDFC